MESYLKIFDRAAERKGGASALSLLLGDKVDDQLLTDISDAEILSAFTKKIFQSGFVWRVVENKWPNFEEIFFEFNIEKMLMMPNEMLEQKASDPRIIRNYNKVKTIKENAQMIFNEQENQPFGEFLANWPSDNIIDLWAYLKKHGSRLGGNTGPYALRVLGKDTFIISRDVEAYFRAHDIVTGGIQTKSSLNAMQKCFNQWQEESGLSLTQLSRLIAFSTGDNDIQVN